MSTEPRLLLDDAMLARAGAALRNGACSQAVIEDAFRDVPLSNYAIGLLLHPFEMVVGVTDRGGSLVCVSNNPADGFDTLRHRLRLDYGHKPKRFIKHLQISGIAPPPGPS